MRKINMILSTKAASHCLSPNSRIAAIELEEQKLLNAELLRICEQQRKLIAEQSGMIEEILEGIGIGEQ